MTDNTEERTDNVDEIQIFSYQDKQVRTVEKDGEPWWVLKDICEVLELSNSRMIAERLDEDEKGVSQIYTPGGKQEMAVVNESGLYNVILRSDKPQAKPFRKWVTSEVLPAIRKHGGYLTPEKVEEALLNPDTIIRLATDLKAEREKRLRLEEQAQKDKPKVLFADAVATSKTSILIGELAKVLKQNGIDMGQNRLFEWMRRNGYLVQRKGTDYNMPTQRAMEAGLFEIKETSITHADGHVSVNKTPKVTGEGQQYFINRFLQ